MAQPAGPVQVPDAAPSDARPPTTVLPPWLRELYPFGHHFHTLPDGRRMHYVDEGSGDEVALLLHGNPTWSFLYRNVIPGIRRDFRVVAPDHVGFGLSDKPEDPTYHSLAQHAANLDSLANALDLRDVTLVVHDWGGPIGLLWAVRNPERVRRLVILNTLAFPPRTKRRLTPWHALFAGPLGPVLGKDLNLVVTSAMRMAVAKRLPRDPYRAYHYPFQTRASRQAPLRLARMVPNGPDHPTAALLREIQENLPKLAHVPTVLAWGERDPVMPPKFISKWQAAIPGIRRIVRVPDASHFLPEDSPASVARAIHEVRAQS